MALIDALFEVGDEEFSFGGRRIERIEARKYRFAFGEHLEEFPEEFFALFGFVEFVEVEVG